METTKVNKQTKNHEPQSTGTPNNNEKGSSHKPIITALGNLFESIDIQFIFISKNRRYIQDNAWTAMNVLHDALTKDLDDTLLFLNDDGQPTDFGFSGQPSFALVDDNNKKRHLVIYSANDSRTILLYEIIGQAFQRRCEFNFLASTEGATGLTPFRDQLGAFIEKVCATKK